MKNPNVGIVSLFISNKLRNSYFNNNLINEAQNTAFKFFDVVKKSPLLQLEFKVFNNIKDKYIDNDIIATRYIDNNIKLFDVYTINEIEKEREKLNQFIINENFDVQSDNNYLLFNAIDKLIEESLKNPIDVDVDGIHDAFTYLLNHIKTQKNKIVENVNDNINDDVIEIAINKFNEKYDNLNEDERSLLKTLINSNEKEKENLLENYKKETLSLLEKINNPEAKIGVNKAIQKINEMCYNKNTVDDNIISLFELKRDLL